MALGERRGAHVVDVRQSAPRAVAEISACETIVTSSLHGLITADALGIPAVWVGLDPAHEMGDFKFADYEAAVTPGVSRGVSFGEGRELSDLLAHVGVADADTVDRLVDGLWETGQQLRGALSNAPRFPLGIIGARRG